ncbi:uncharacterized protein LOC132198760 [Neocloeon triangulifer]|uniref:uncharacterized protein LOC132198760 n=1 Tax=Neocloeon triangulifer TaxID=2078957 RepID=UPI00286F0A6D|nr:uncharacterized protein LOC132198760 [Neocloeon triangulifer]
MHHHFQTLALVVCCTLLVQGASVVRVPRVYNILIKSDGAIAPSEAVSLDSLNEEKAPENNSRESGEKSNEEPAQEPQEPLPVLDAKDGGIVDGVNYTEVPLSRAYPLTRFTVPIIAARHPFPYLHGGLILGPVPKAAAAQQQREFPGGPADFEQQSEIDETQSYRQDPQKAIQQLPLPQYRSRVDHLNLDPAAFRERILQPQRAQEQLEEQEEEEEEDEQ